MTEIEFVEQPTATLVRSTASDDDVALAAWVSFDTADPERLKDRDRVKGLINFLLRERHMSPFEHSTFTFLIDCPLFVAREFHRHRTMSYNEVSGRYTQMKPRFYLPEPSRPLVQQGKAGAYNFVAGDLYSSQLVTDQICDASEEAYGRYQKMVEVGVAKEVARMVLPVNLMTQFYATVNARNLMHFLSLRTSPQALYEIRQVAGDMEEILAAQMPFTYEAWKNNDPNFTQLKQATDLKKG